MRRLPLIAILSFLAALSASAAAYACTCEPPPPIEEVLESADAFWGEVTERSSWGKDVVAELEILKDYDGSPGRTAKVRSPRACGVGLDIGQKYLIVASKDMTGTYVVGSCGHSRHSPFEPTDVTVAPDRDWKPIRKRFEKPMRKAFVESSGHCFPPAHVERVAASLRVYPDGAFDVLRVTMEGEVRNTDFTHCMRRTLASRLRTKRFDGSAFDAELQSWMRSNPEITFQNSPHATTSDDVVRARLLRVELSDSESTAKLKAHGERGGLHKHRAIGPICQSEGFDAAMKEYESLSSRIPPRSEPAVRAALLDCALERDDLSNALRLTELLAKSDSDLNELRFVLGLAAAQADTGLPLTKGRRVIVGDELDRRLFLTWARTTAVGWANSPALLEAVAQALTSGSKRGKHALAALAYHRAGLLRPEHHSAYEALAMSVAPGGAVDESMSTILKQQFDEQRGRKEQEEASASLALAALLADATADVGLEADVGPAPPPPLPVRSATATQELTEEPAEENSDPSILWFVLGGVVVVAGLLVLMTGPKRRR